MQNGQVNYDIAVVIKIDLLILTKFKMNDGNSFSFPSFESYNYPSHNNLTFHEIEPTQQSHYDNAKDSMIKHFPGKQNYLGNHLQIVLLLQAAEIERLTANLHEYRTKFKRLSNNEKDYISFQNQTNQLLQVKDEMEMKQKRMSYFVQNQKEELISESKYAQSLENKYKRALKFIQQGFIARQQLQAANQLLKDQIDNTQHTFQVFKKESIRQYQIIREELERTKNLQLSFELNKLASEKQRWGELLTQEEQKINQQKRQIEEKLKQEVETNGRLQKQIEEQRHFIESISANYNKTQQQKEDTLALISTQIERLNSIIRQKVIQLKEADRKTIQLEQNSKKKYEKIGELQRDQQRDKHKIILYQQQITKLNIQISRLSAAMTNQIVKINQMNISLEQKSVQIRIMENKLNNEMQSKSEIMSRSQLVFNKQIQQFKITNIALAKEIEKKNAQLISKDQMYRQKDMVISTRLKEAETGRQNLRNQIGKLQQRAREIEERYKTQNNRLLRQIQQNQRKIQQLLRDNKVQEQRFKKQNIEYTDGAKKIYQFKIKEIAQKMTQTDLKLKNMQETKSTLQRNMVNLKNQLQKCEREKQELKKDRTFEQMITQIQNLCQSVVNKDNTIHELNTQMTNLSNELRKLIKQSEVQKQMLTKLINFQQLSSSTRKQDTKAIIEQIRKQFNQQNGKFQQIKDQTNSITTVCTEKQRELYDFTQSQMIQGKEYQISDLRERLTTVQKESQNRMELKQIISKIIAITKQNSELRNQSNKKGIQLQNQIRLNKDSKLQNSKNIDNILNNLRQKQEICKKLLIQLQQSHQLLLQQKQQQKTLQIDMIQFEEQKSFNQRQLQAKNDTISQLKNSLDQANNNCKHFTQCFQNQKKLKSNLRIEVKELREAHTYIINQKDSQISKIKKESQLTIHQLTQTQKQSNIAFQQGNYKRMTAQMNELSFQLGKIKDQNNILIFENNQLREDTIRAGSALLQMTKEVQQAKYLQQKYLQIQKNCQYYKQKITDLTQRTDEKQKLNYLLDNVRLQNQIYRRQNEKSQKMLMNYSQKVEILSAQFQRLESIIQDLKKKNSQLMSINYQMSLELQKSKINQQKIAVLDQQINRLQRQRVNLTEEVNICRLQISKDSLLDRQANEHLSLFVLLFSEIDSLRSLLNFKDSELQELRKISLHH